MKKLFLIIFNYFYYLSLIDSHKKLQRWYIIRKYSLSYNEFIRQFINFLNYAYNYLWRRPVYRSYFKKLRERTLIQKIPPNYIKWWFDKRFAWDLYKNIRFTLLISAYIGKVIFSIFWILFVLIIRSLFSIFIRYSHVLWLLHLYFYLLIRITLWLKWIISPKLYYEFWVILSKIDSWCAMYLLQEFHVYLFRRWSQFTKPATATYVNVNTYKKIPPKHSPWIQNLMVLVQRVKVFSLLTFSSKFSISWLKSFFWNIFLGFIYLLFFFLDIIQKRFKSFIFIFNLYILIL